jgi:hypothetical protein
MNRSGVQIPLSPPVPPPVFAGGAVFGAWRKSTLGSGGGTGGAKGCSPHRRYSSLTSFAAGYAPDYGGPERGAFLQPAAAPAFAVQIPLSPPVPPPVNAGGVVFGAWRNSTLGSGGGTGGAKGCSPHRRYSSLTSFAAGYAPDYGGPERAAFLQPAAAPAFAVQIPHMKLGPASR